MVPELVRRCGQRIPRSASVVLHPPEPIEGERNALDHTNRRHRRHNTRARPAGSRLCLLVMIGVRADGRKELVALTDGYRESTESWADLLRDCSRRGMRAPVLAVGDGALGFWGALREVFGDTREQRCWFHKIANVLGALP